MSVEPVQAGSPRGIPSHWIALEPCAPREVFPAFKGRFVHSTHMTSVHWTIEAGAVFPRHSHPHEQVVNLIDGEFALTIDGEARRLGPRSVAVIPSNAAHSGKALTPCHLIDGFYPIREDYRAGTDGRSAR